MEQAIRVRPVRRRPVRVRLFRLFRVMLCLVSRRVCLGSSRVSRLRVVRVVWWLRGWSRRRRVGVWVGSLS
ncbi:hypothetical protein, partial [Nocardia sp. NPDC004260]